MIKVSGMTKKEMALHRGLTAAVRDSHNASVKAGWYHNPKTGRPIRRNKGEMIALMHSELSEALEGIRKDKQDDHLPHRKSVEVEMTDAIIRIFDFAGKWGLDLAGAYIEKRRYNNKRADHKLKNRKKAGGKKF